MHIKRYHAIAAAVAAAIALTAVDLRPAFAAPLAPKRDAKVTHSSAVTEFSAGKRHRRYRSYRHHRGDRVALGAVLGLFGTIAGLAAAQEARRHGYYYYDDPYYAYPYGPHYYRYPY